MSYMARASESCAGKGSRASIMQRLTVFAMAMLLVSTVQAEDIVLQTLLGTGYREQELQMAKGTIF